MIQSSQPVWSHREASQICLNPVWRVGAEGLRSEPKRSECERSEAEDRSPTSQTDAGLQKYRGVSRFGHVSKETSGQTDALEFLNPSRHFWKDRPLFPRMPLYFDVFHFRKYCSVKSP